MAVTPEPKDFQTEVLDRLERLENKLDADVQRIDERTDKWEERFLQVSKDNLAISRTVNHRCRLQWSLLAAYWIRLKFWLRASQDYWASSGLEYSAMPLAWYCDRL
jgi:hypothetical protein